MPLLKLRTHPGAKAFVDRVLESARRGDLTAIDQVGKAGFRLKVFIVNGLTGMPLPIVDQIHRRLRYVRRAMHPASFAIVIEQERIRPGFWTELRRSLGDKLIHIFRTARAIDPNAELLISGLPECWDISSMTQGDVVSDGKYESYFRNWERLSRERKPHVRIPARGEVPISLASTSVVSTFRPLFSVADMDAASWWNASLVMLPLTIALTGGATIFEGQPADYAHTGSLLMYHAFESVGRGELFPEFRCGFVPDKHEGFMKLLEAHLDLDEPLLFDPRSEDERGGEQAVHDALNLEMALLKMELGSEHVRIGPVLYSPGPSVGDLVADAFFFHAGMRHLQELRKRGVEFPSLTIVRRNLDRALRHGMDATLLWPGQKKAVAVRDLVPPFCAAILAGVKDEHRGNPALEAEAMLEVIRKRVAFGGIGKLKLRWLQQGASAADITRLLARLSWGLGSACEWAIEWKWLAHALRWMDQGGSAPTVMLQVTNHLEYGRVADTHWPEKWSDTPLGRTK